MKTCGKPYHGTLGIVVNCSEETPCRDCLLIEVGRLEYMVQSLQGELARPRSAPVSVEVPEPTHEQWLALAEEAHAGAFLDFMSGASAYGLWLRRNMPSAIPSDRVLKERERAVPVEEWEELIAALPLEDMYDREMMSWIRDLNIYDPTPREKMIAKQIWACAQDWSKRKFATLRALRS